VNDARALPRTRPIRWANVAAAVGLAAALLTGCSQVFSYTLAQPPTATATEFKIDTPTVVKAGSYSYVLYNAGSLVHEVLVFRPSLARDALPVDADGNLSEDAPGMNKISDGDNINPGQTQTRTIDLTEPGTYLFVCNLPGHYKNGMYTWVTVR
jgi:uncharacterized cupredoxin-like copper-binding protein